jgi:citronellol/citronellal dehydrogenase
LPHTGNPGRRRLSGVKKPAKDFTGNFLIDDTFLAENGVTDFDRYRVDLTKDLMPDFFVPDWIPPPQGVSLKAVKT